MKKILASVFIFSFASCIASAQRFSISSPQEYSPNSAEQRINLTDSKIFLNFLYHLPEEHFPAANFQSIEIIYRNGKKTVRTFDEEVIGRLSPYDYQWGKLGRTFSMWCDGKKGKVKIVNVKFIIGKWIDGEFVANDPEKISFYPRKDCDLDSTEGLKDSGELSRTTTNWFPESWTILNKRYPGEIPPSVAQELIKPSAFRKLVINAWR